MTQRYTDREIERHRKREREGEMCGSRFSCKLKQKLTKVDGLHTRLRVRACVTEQISLTQLAL